MDFVDLVVHHFKHGSDPGDLRCLREPGELIGGHDQVGAWGLVDVVVVNTDKFVTEVALEWAWPSLRVELIVASSHGKHKGSLICLALCMVDVPVDTSGVVLLGFPIPWGAIDADIENSASTEGR